MLPQKCTQVQHFINKDTLFLPGNYKKEHGTVSCLSYLQVGLSIQVGGLCVTHGLGFTVNRIQVHSIQSKYFTMNLE